MNGIAYDVSEEERRGAYLSSLSAATGHATDAIFAMTDAISYRPFAPISISESSSGFTPTPFRLAAFAAPSVGVGSEQGLEGGPIKVGADVAMTWSIVPMQAPSPPSPMPVPSPGASTQTTRRALGGLRFARV